MHSIEPACEGGVVLLRALQDRGLTLEKGEDQAGLSEGYFSRLIRGKRRLRSLPIALTLEKLYGVPPEAWGQPVERQASQPEIKSQEKRIDLRSGGAGRSARAARSERVEGT